MGTFTTDVPKIHEVCHGHQAWLQIDAAFGILARIYPSKRNLCQELDLVDSISFDDHKFGNVPYDCGVFLTNDMATLGPVFGNIGTTYLGGGGDGYSPLNLGFRE